MTQETYMPTTTALKLPSRPVIERTEGTPSGEEQRIGDMLTYRRAHDSAGEAEFIIRYILPFKPEAISDETDIHALVVRIPKKDGAPSERAFCAHTDSVHNRQVDDLRQTVGFDSVRREFFVNDPKQRDCLGADDAAGCYVLIRMIEEKIPGLYVFFRGEERGGIGSGYVTENRQDLFQGIEYAIQFDRRGTESIITEMMCGMTCSDEFAIALGDALGMGHKPDPTGSFTDTANLSEVVPECTNVSVGYEHEHSSAETLDVDYLLALVEACIDTFSDSELSLPCARHPGEYGESVVFYPDFGLRTPHQSSAISVYNLPDMTRGELRMAIAEMHDDDIVELLYEVGDALGEALEGAYIGDY